MIKKIVNVLSLVVVLQLSVQAQVISTETFETETGSSTSFTDNSQVFNITSQAQGPFDIQTAYPGTGWNGTAVDNIYIDNDGFAAGGLGTGFTISSAGAVPFNIKSVWLYLADNTANVNVTGTLTIVGKLSSVGQFTVTSSPGFNNTNIGVNNGFTLIDFTTFGGSNNSNVVIDQLVLTTTTNFNYVGLDAFQWSTVCPTVTVSPLSQTNVSCNGGSNGAASVSASGGSGLTYNWTPGNPTGDGTASVTGLTAGTWTCTVTNSCSNSGVATFTVTQPTTLTLTPSSQTNVACNGGSNGAASVNAASGGAGSYTYNWTPGNPTGDGTISVTGLTAGNWTCTVTDANSCTKAVTFTVTQPTTLTLTPSSQTNVACNGGSNGAASVNAASGGAGSYTYNWTPGNPTGDGTTSVTGLTAGNWTCTVTDANSCTKAVTFTVTQPTSLVLTVASQTNVTSYGGNNGAASVNAATGGAGSYTYNWTPGNPTGDGTTAVTGLTAGVWTCTVTDANSCTTSLTFTITQPASALNFDGTNDIVQSSNTINTTLALSNKITVEAWVNPTNATYLGCIVGNYQTNGSGMQFLLRRDYSNYTFWIDNGAGFNNVTSAATVTTGAWVHLAGTWDGSTVKLYVNGILSGTASVTGSNIVSSTNQLWIGGNSAGTPEMFAGSVDEVRVWNRALCQSEIQNNMNCEIASSGTGLLVNYHFNQGSDNANNSGITTLTDASGNSINGTLNGFFLTGAVSNWVGQGAVTSGTTCGAFSIPSVTVTASSQTDISCNGGTNGAASVNASGGSGLTYNWTPGNPTGDGTASVSGLTTGNWTCTVTNDCGGSGTHVFTISEPAALSASSVAGTILCNGGSTTVTVSATGGTTSYSGTGTYTVTAGTITYTVTDANSCSATTTVTVTEPSALVASVATGTILCNGGSTTVTVSATGGTTSYSGTGTYTVTAGTLTYTVTDANACSATTTVTLSQPAAIASSQTVTLCAGQSIAVGSNTYSNTGTYTDVLTAQNGCDSTVTTDLTVNSAIDVSTTTSSNTVTANESSASSYQWLDCDNGNTPISGETNQSFAAPSNGNYAVIVTIGSCSDTSACINISGMSIANFNAQAIKLYPNPTNGLFSLVLSSDAQVVIIDALGKEVKSVWLTTGGHSIDLSACTNGVYFIRVTSRGVTQTARIIRKD